MSEEAILAFAFAPTVAFLVRGHKIKIILFCYI